RLSRRGTGPAREPRTGAGRRPAGRSDRAARRGSGRARGARGDGGARRDDARAGRLREHRSAMIARYTRPEMARIWSEETRLGHWLAIELALVYALPERGAVPAAAARAAR